MPRILRTAQSRLDFDEIWAFIAQDNPAAAAELIRLFDKQLHLLAGASDAGRKRPELSANLHSFPVGNYLLFYIPIEDGIELIRVLHGARDIQSEYFK